ncbi:hypothetical protein KNV62_gp65 [uncultured phage cr273_1]|uniref:Uncharacterized protein n=2 Tax=Buhlduvirus TaxID=2948643 RepID=A0A7M1RUB1_9CAUD|nr:hypothetical protein KNV61_gp68 [uncultured phage cr272_1]YP_010113526.1 hypothetical protein KNV62_gp65 [uncultured phage cr273_1]QOR57791.1 hypothetical protein [uncultured phage cr272_1]QOR57886.1 hypothetical protein [uncultured phage cr273_1]
MEEQSGVNMVHHVVKNLTNVAIVDCKVQLTTHNLTKVNWPVAYPYFTDRTLADAKKLCPFLDSVCLAENRNIHSKKEWPYAIQATFTMPVTNTSVEAIVKFAESCEYVADRITLVLATWSYMKQESMDVMKKFRNANR